MPIERRPCRARNWGRNRTGGSTRGSLETIVQSDSSGALVIPGNAHIRLAAHENNNGLRILRRGYSFTDGIDSTGNLLGGLFFLAFVKNPAQFVTLQRKLGTHDALNEYILHIGGALFLCPPGLDTGQDWATQLYG